MIEFTAEVLEVKAKKDGIDKLFRLVLETSEEQVLELQKYIASDIIKVSIPEGKNGSNT